MQETLTLADILNLVGERIAGAGIDEADAIQRKLSDTGKPWSAVSAWVVIDVINIPAGCMPKPMLPLVLGAHHVHPGEDHRFGSDRRVLTGFATCYDQRGIFETVDQVYILVGKGFRKPADYRLVGGFAGRLRDYTIDV